jgi:hypothetical protein
VKNKEMKSKVNLVEKYGSFPPDYWQAWVGHKVLVDCKTWTRAFALQTWGHGYETRATGGEIKDFKIPRGQTFPLFDIYFEETGSIYNKLDLEYVLKYSPEVPLQYHQLKATYILHLATSACPVVSSDHEAAPAATQEDDVVEVISEGFSTVAVSKGKKRQSAPRSSQGSGR